MLREAPSALSTIDRNHGTTVVIPVDTATGLMYRCGVALLVNCPLLLQRMLLLLRPPRQGAVSGTRYPRSVSVTLYPVM
jgi:hypothetical protein